MSNNSERFLEAFNTIDKHLRRKTGLNDRNNSFSTVLDKAAKSNSAVRNLKIDLQEFSDLRNAIVHERTDGHVIAEPHEDTLRRLEQILKLVSKPPVVRDFMTKKPLEFKSTDPLGDALEVMHKNSFSQVPISRDGKLVGLLTANTITNWLGADVERDLFSVKETLISEVLEYTEDPNHVAFMNPEHTVFDVFELIQEYELKGDRLEAIHITNSGKATESILGIITIWDLPKMNQATLV